MTATSREALIKCLRRKAEAWDYINPAAKGPNICREAAEMLKTDAQQVAMSFESLIGTTQHRPAPPAQQVAVPEGYALVPLEPTPQMSAAGFCVTDAEHDPSGVYRAMLKAAPQGGTP